MNSFFVGNTLINDAYIGNIRVDDLFVTQSILPIDYLIIAGGGGGGATGPGITPAGYGGGGGAGGLITGSITLVRSLTNYQVIVGGFGAQVSGSDGINGENSSIIGGLLNITTLGGGGGGKYLQNGKDGGSGGGGGGATPGHTAGGTGSIGQGFNGAPDYDGIANYGGGGGGAKSAGLNNLGGSGSVWLDGVTYGVGGDSRAGQQAIGYGGGGPDTKNGNYGTVIIRYPGTGSKVQFPQTANITTFFSASYTYHRFFTFATGSYIATSSFIY